MNYKYLLILLASYQSGVLAASFDCSKANGFVETTICQNTTLSALDDELKSVYKKALSDNKTSSSEQKIWLKTTRACTTADCLTQAYTDRLHQLNTSKAVAITWQTYKGLGISFDYPSDRKVKAETNALKITSHDMSGSDYLIHFEIGAGDLKQAITNTAIFTEKSPNQWVASIGRFENPPAETIKAHNWTGLKTVITCGIEDKETGVHAAGGECLWALISDGKHYLLADTQGIVGLDENTLKTLLSIQFEQ
ncbi:MAG: hypothetical protein WAX77_13695 [Methylococcaceae bacterium]